MSNTDFEEPIRPNPFRPNPSGLGALIGNMVRSAMPSPGPAPQMPSGGGDATPADTAARIGPLLREWWGGGIPSSVGAPPTGLADLISRFAQNQGAQSFEE